MRCDQIRDLLSPYMDGMTSEKENRLVEAHLAGCIFCRQELEKMQFISACLNKIEVPPCPEGLALDVRRRILEEKNKVFSLREASKPKRQGWLAAGIAGIALLVGIYINSILPVENIASLWRDKESEGDKNVAVVEKGPWSRLMNVAGGSKDEKRVAGVDEKQVVIDNRKNMTVADKGNGLTPAKPGSTEKKGVLTTYLAEQMAAQIKVGDVDKSAEEVIKLAQANQAEYKVIDGMQPLSGGVAKAIELSVEKDKADVIMEQLSYIGEVSSTSRSQVELTEKYNKIQEEINILNEKMAQADREGNTAARADLEKKVKELNQAKSDIEEQMAKITLKVYLVENIKP